MVSGFSRYNLRHLYYKLVETMARSPITAKEFEIVKVLMKISRPMDEEKISIAKMIIVDGKSNAEVAAIFGCSRQNVSNLLTRISGILDIYNEARLLEATEFEDTANVIDNIADTLKETARTLRRTRKKKTSKVSSE